MIKELLRKLKCPRIKIRQRYRKKLPVIYKTTNDPAFYQTRAYEPSNIGDTYNILFWSRRRVKELGKYINEHLKKFNLLTEGDIRQTDNDSEYIGCWCAKSPSAYTIAVE